MVFMYRCFKFTGFLWNIEGDIRIKFKEKVIVFDSMSGHAGSVRQINTYDITLESVKGQLLSDIWKVFDILTSK